MLIWRQARHSMNFKFSAYWDILIDWGQAQTLSSFLGRVPIIWSILQLVLTKSPLQRLLNSPRYPSSFFLVQRFIKLSAAVYEERQWLSTQVKPSMTDSSDPDFHDADDERDIIIP